MKGTFWVILILLFLFANEYLTKFLLAISVGDLGFSDAYINTFKYVSIDSYLFTASFRAIPYVALAVFAAKSQSAKSQAGRILVWFAALLLATFHFYGYWNMQHSLFAEAHTSSTSALATIWIPIWALFIGIIGFFVIFIGKKVNGLFHKQE